MNESRTLTTSIRRVVIPLLVAVLLVVGTILISSSSLIRIEDVTVNRILAGTYGTPDWRVQSVNPLLAQVLSLLYRVLPSINWYGGMLLALLLISAATAISLVARKHGGLIPAVIVLSPIVVLLTNSVISTTIAALCTAVGVFALLDGIARKKDGIAQAILGGILFVFGGMLSLTWALIIGVGAAVCWLPCSLRDSRLRAIFIGLPILAVLAGALFGYSALMYNSPELSAYRDNYALYESVQHSSLKQESDELVADYGTSVYSAEHSADDGHDHTEEELAAMEDIRPNSFDAVGWSINDSSLFFTRYSADAKLTDPETLATLNADAKHWDFTPSRLFSEFYETVKKPQFLMLIALFVVSALAVMITSRRRGLVVLMAALIAFGGHFAALAHYYDSFADIAPFYLLSIAVMLYFFDGEDAKAWMKRFLAAPWLRIAVSALVLVVFVAGMGGLLYYTRITPANASQFTVEAVEFLKPYIAEHQDILYIGDNPNDRYKPATLASPVRGEDSTLLAGSYDLYSPRAAAMMEAFGITNPLPDSMGREDMAYVIMGFYEPMLFRLISEYDIYAKTPEEILSYPEYAEMIVQLSAYTPEEIDELIAQDREREAAWDTFAAYMNENPDQFDELFEHDHDHDHEDEDHTHDEEDHDHTEDEHVSSETPEPTSTPNA